VYGALSRLTVALEIILNDKALSACARIASSDSSLSEKMMMSTSDSDS